MLSTILKLKLKQVVGSFEAGSILKFLAPDLLVGSFMALSSNNSIHLNNAMAHDASSAAKLAMVAYSISLFTLIAETRKLFFTGGDIEDFYFVQPTLASRLASFLIMALLNCVIILSVALPTIVLVSLTPAFFSQVIAVSVFAFGLSLISYFLIISFISSLPEKLANSFLTVIQILTALILLAAFQLPIFTRISFAIQVNWWIYVSAFLFFCFLFLLLPVQENIVSKFKETESGSVIDLPSLLKKYGKILFISSGEEEAGLMLFLSNIFRNRSFRLSTIGTAAAPVMVAVYWNLRGLRFVNFSSPAGFMVAEFVAPLASLVVAGVLAHYFLSQSLMGSRDFDAAWLFRAGPKFNVGNFVLGVRKGFLVIVQVPMTIAIFLATLSRNSFLESSIAALTFYLLTHFAVSFFSTAQRSLPFTEPFTQVAPGGVIDLVFLIFFSVVTTFVLFICRGRTESLLMLNFFAFILVGSMEYFSARVINRRIKLGV